MGGGGILHPIIIASRNLKILKLKGTVQVKKKSIGAVKIGFGYIGIVDNLREKALWSNSGNIIFEGNAHLGPGTRIANSGVLIFGDGFMINANTDIICRKKIVFGSNNLLAWDVLVMDTDFHPIYDSNHNRINLDTEIQIGDNVWIGCRSTILKDVNIESGCIIGAHSLVTKSLNEKNSIYRNNDCIKDHIFWEFQ